MSGVFEGMRALKEDWCTELGVDWVCWHEHLVWENSIAFGRCVFVLNDKRREPSLESKQFLLIAYNFIVITTPLARPSRNLLVQKLVSWDD